MRPETQLEIAGTAPRICLGLLKFCEVTGILSIVFLALILFSVVFYVGSNYVVNAVTDSGEVFVVKEKK